MKNITRKARNEILAKPYMTAQDIYKVLPIGMNQCKKIFKTLEEELKEDGIPLFNTRPRVIPTEYFMQKYERRKK